MLVTDVTIKQSHIDKAKKGGIYMTESSPVALALKDAGCEVYSVGFSEICFLDPELRRMYRGKRLYTHVDVKKDLQTWMINFSIWGSGEPGTFQL